MDGSGSGFARSTATARQLQDYIEGNVYSTVAVDDVPSEQTDEPAEATDEPAEGIDTPKDYTEPAWIPLTSEDPDEPPEDPYELETPATSEDPYEPPEDPYELEDGPYADSPGPAPAEATEEPQVPGEAPEQVDDGMSPLPVATGSVAELRPVWYRSVEDGGYQTTLGHGYDFWEIQVRRAARSR